jgi:FMN-dependent NADH-azoreductase
MGASVMRSPCGAPPHDGLVIGTPVYNYNVPAALKAWVDHIVRKT